jgi:hypothetical protein
MTSGFTIDVGNIIFLLFRECFVLVCEGWGRAWQSINFDRDLAFTK